MIDESENLEDKIVLVLIYSIPLDTPNLGGLKNWLIYCIEWNEFHHIPFYFIPLIFCKTK